MRALTVECLPGDLIEELELDVSGLAVGKTLRVRGCAGGCGEVPVMDDDDQVVAAVAAPRTEEEETAETEAEAGAEAGPEVLTEKKEEEGEEGADKGKDAKAAGKDAKPPARMPRPPLPRRRRRSKPFEAAGDAFFA